jgi:hypothetical protein
VGGLLGGSLLTLHTDRLAEVPDGAKQPVHPDLDQFFRYGPEGEMIDGSMRKVPKLEGCSGGAIWQYREPSDMLFWNAEQCLRIAGIQSGYFSSKGYFRAKSWTYVRAMIDKMVV